MFIPITLRASYKEEFWCAVYIGFVKLQLVPAKPKKEKKKKKAKKQTQKTEQPKKATEKKPSLIKKYGIEWLLNLIKKVAELAVSALQDFFSHILVKKLSLSISVAGDDAADTAIKYGKYCAVVYPAVGKGYGVDINPNFSEKAETEINFDFAARIFAFRLIGLAVKHGIKGIKLLAEVKND
jgi:ribosomal protein S25